jgi:hypothetical protein
MRKWDDLRESRGKFAQCPVELLQSGISDKLLRLYLLLWWEAFSNPKWNNGSMYAEMTYKQISKRLNCNKNYAVKYINELIERKLIIKVRSQNINRYYFTLRGGWEI